MTQPAAPPEHQSDDQPHTFDTARHDHTIKSDPNGIIITFDALNASDDDAQLKIVVAREDLTDHDWVHTTRADLYCEHDTDAVHANGVEVGREELAEEITPVLARWHDDAGHAGVFRFCSEQTCADLRQHIPELAP